MVDHDEYYKSMGYEYVGTIDVSAACAFIGALTLVGGGVVTLASPLPGDSAAVLGFAGALLDSSCVLSSTISELTDCQLGSVDIYVKWWTGDVGIGPNCA